MKTFILIIASIITSRLIAQTAELGNGKQPQLSIDTKGTIHFVYGKDNSIYYSSSSTNGNSFTKPVEIGVISDMHLGMSRGPQIASSKDFTVVTAIDKSGNIHSFMLDQKSGKWTKTKNVNDLAGTAEEGLMSLAADDDNNFYAVWLDLREDQKNKIVLASLDKKGVWSTNRIIYKSPDGTVCECCKPSIAVRENHVAIMYRNWIEGSRDLYVLSSADKGSTFSNAQKLGEGTWKLNGCPMDGGGIVFDKNNVIHTAWQREGVVYYDQPGLTESRIAEGKSCSIFGKRDQFITWQEGSKIYCQQWNGTRQLLAEGKTVNIVQLKDNSLLASWESNGTIMFKTIKF